MDQLNSLFALFMREQKLSGRASATLRGYETSYKWFIKLMPEAGLENINKDLLMNFFEKLQTRERDPKESKKKIGVENTTLITYKNKLVSFFNWLADEGKIKADLFKGVKLARPVGRSRIYLLNEEVNKIFAAIEFNINWKNNLIKKRNLAIIVIALFLGLRKGELLGLKLTDIYLDKKLLLVRGEVSKSKRNKTLAINNNAFSILLDYLEERKKKKYHNEFLFVSDNKDMGFTEHGLKHMLVKIEKAVGFSFHMHQFRHTFAINLRSQGANVMQIKDLMGHVDIRMTDNYLRNFPVENSREMLNDLEIGKLM